MNIEKERKAFEHWGSGCGLNISTEDGLYRSHVVGWMWLAWAARSEMESHTKEELIELIKHERDHSEQLLTIAPAGFKLVPVEPTYEMLKEIHINENFKRAALEARYKAMLAAAPQPDHIPDIGKMGTPSANHQIKKGDMRVIDGILMTCTDPEIGRWQGGEHEPTDTQMLNWLIEKEYVWIDREAIKKAMRGKK